MKLNNHVVHITYKEKNLETRYYQLQCRMPYVNDKE
jgi:hypothetical protein